MPYRICVVCSGNICRSPMAEVVLRSAFADEGLAGLVEVDSAGTGDWHAGMGADPRALAALEGLGYDGSAHRARRFGDDWLADRDLVLVADSGHRGHVGHLARDAAQSARVRYLREFDPDADDVELADPYYDDDAGFERCLGQIVAAAPGVVAHVRGELGRRGDLEG